jgi:hypothetical protein
MELNFFWAGPEIGFPVPFMFVTKTEINLSFFKELEFDSLHKSKELPNTGVDESCWTYK